MRAGYAEVVKHGLIADADFFAWLETNGPAVIKGDPEACRHAVLTSCRAKASIVQADETEKGSRALLNLGHTFGHALEAQTGYSNALNHGEAVAIGLGLAFDLSVRMGLCPGDDRDRLRGHLVAVGLPVGLDGLTDGGWSAAGLIDLMGQDKKVRSGAMTFVLLRGIGQAFITQDVDLGLLAEVLEEALEPQGA
jgi:3-dehydroquinate synthase